CSLYKMQQRSPTFQYFPYTTLFRSTYVLKVVKVTQTNESGNVDTSNLKLYTTTDINARKITPKDEGIGVDEIWYEKTIGQEINEDRKSTRLNSSHVSISYAVFCLKK